jgi:hypothetical protein
MAETKRTILERLDANVRQLLDLFLRPKVRFRIGPVQPRTLSKGPITMAFILTDIQHVAVTLEADDAAGNAVPFDFSTPAVWTSTDETVLTISTNADGSNADIATTGKIGAAQVNVLLTMADSSTVKGALDFEVTTSAVSFFKLVPGTPATK